MFTTNPATDRAKILHSDYSKIQFLKHTKHIIAFSLENTVIVRKIKICLLPMLLIFIDSQTIFLCLTSYTMKNRDDSCLKSQGLPSQMTMGGDSFLKLVLLHCTPSHLYIRTSARREFLYIAIKKAKFFLFSHKKREEFAFGCDLLREKGKSVSQLWCSSCSLSPQNFEEPVRTLENPSPAPSALFGKQKTANAVHEGEHLLLFPLPPPFFLSTCLISLPKL